MAEFDSIVHSIKQTSDSIKTLYFRPPGIFTNALILKPDITTLLRDADVHESSLYNVDTNGIAERKDGSRGVVDAVNYEFDQYDLQQMNESTHNTENKPAVIIVPRDVDSNVPEVNKGVKNLLARFNEENLSEYEFDALVSMARELLEKYPVKEIEEQLQQFESNYKTVSQEIIQHEETLETQRSQLSQLNNSVGDRRLSTNRSPQKRNASELIALEEQEIKQLEEQLSIAENDS